MQPCGPRDNIDLNCFGPATAEALVVEAAKSGNHSAFEELWARHSNTAFKSVYRIMGNRYDAEDALQDAWIKAFVHLKTFDGRSRFSTWLTRIAINSALMMLRRRRSRLETSMDWSGDGETWQQWDVPDGSLNIEDLYLEKEAELLLKEAIERLRPPLRSVMEIQRLHYRSNKEVADAAGISVAAVKSRLLRARALLRNSLRSSMPPTLYPDTTPLSQETERTARLATRRNRRSSANDRIAIQPRSTEFSAAVEASFPPVNPDPFM